MRKLLQWCHKWAINAYTQEYHLMGSLGRKNVYFDIHGEMYIIHSGKVFNVVTTLRNEHYVTMDEKYYGYDAVKER